MAQKLMQKFGKYEILEEVGRGAMGIVYKARDPIIGRLVALKTVMPGLLAEPELLKRFYREAQAAGGLQHPNIVTIFDMGEVDGLPYIAMAFVEGESLEKIIARKPVMSLAQKLKIVVQFCRGLDHAHKHDVIHRDIKPANIVVDNDGTVKLVDFGIVHLMTASMTQTGMALGTVPYMSPQQLRGEPVDARSDIWSVGVVMYEFLAYMRPFQGPNQPAVMLKILQEEPAPLSAVIPEIPPTLERLVRKCLRKNPEERFQSLEDLTFELEPLEQTLKNKLVSEMVRQGQELLTKRDLVKALEVFRGALKLDSSHSVARDLMNQVNAEIRRLEASSRVRQYLGEGELLLKQGEYPGAIRALEEVLKLDPQQAAARALLERARKEKGRADEVHQGLTAGRQAYQEGDLTLAESELKKVLALDDGNLEATVLLTKVQEERAAREKRYRLREAVWRMRKLLSQERYEEAVKPLENLQTEFLGEEEIQQLLKTAREGVEKRQRAKGEVKTIRALLAKERFKEAVERAEKARSEFPDEAEFGELYDLAKTQQEAAERRRQLEWDVFAVRELLTQGHYDEALEQLEYLQKEFPDEKEIQRLLETTHQKIEERRRVEGEFKAIEALLEEQKYKEAVDRAETVRFEFPQEAESTRLYELAKTQYELAERQQRLESELAALQDLITTQEYEAALERAQRLEQEFPGEQEVQQVLQTARQKVEERRQVEEEFKVIRALLEKQKYKEAVERAETVRFEFPQEAESTRLYELVKTQYELAERRQRLQSELAAVQDLITAQEYDAALERAQRLEQEFPGEQEVQQVLQTARQKVEERRRVEEDFKAIEALLEERKYKEAVERAETVRLEFPQEAESTRLYELAKAQYELAERQQRLESELAAVRDLITAQEYDSALERAEQLHQEFPGEKEVQQVLQTARQEVEERRQVEEEFKVIKALLEEQKYKEAVERAETIRLEFPQNAESTRLYELAQTQYQSAERQHRLEQQASALQELISAGRYEAAVERGERLQREFPGSPELARLLELARREQKATEQQRQVVGLSKAIQTLLDEGKFEQAAREAKTGLEKFPESHDFARLLVTAEQSLEEQCKQAALEEQERKRREVQEVTGAVRALLDGRKYKEATKRLETALARVPQEPELAELYERAKTEYEEAERQRLEPELAQLRQLIEGKEFGAALERGKGLQEEFPASTEVSSLLELARREKRAEQRRELVQTLRHALPVAWTQRARAAVGALKQQILKRPVPIALVVAALVTLTAITYLMTHRAPTKGTAATPQELELRAQAQQLWEQRRLDETLATWRKLEGLHGALQQQAHNEIARIEQLENDEQNLFSQAQAAESQKKWDEAEDLYKKVVSLNAAMTERAQQAIDTIKRMKQGEDPAGIEKDKFVRAENLYQKREYRQAQSIFQQVVDLNVPDSKLLPKARSRIRDIDKAMNEQQLYDAALNDKSAGRSEQARDEFKRVVGMNGDHRAQAESRIGEIEKELEQRAAQQKAAEAQKEKQIAAAAIASHQKDVQDLLAQRRYSEALARLPEISQLGGDVSSLRKDIEAAYQGELRDLEGRYTQAKNQRNIEDLKKLADEFGKLAGRGGTLAATAAQAESQIRDDIQELQRAKQEPPREAARPQPAVTVTCAVLPVKREPFNAAVPQMQAQKFLDQDIELSSGPNCGLRPEVVQLARPGASVTLFVQIDENGSVTSARLLDSNVPAFAQAVQRAVEKGWRFNPPTCQGKKVKTGVSVKVEFQ